MTTPPCPEQPERPRGLTPEEVAEVNAEFDAWLLEFGVVTRNPDEDDETTITLRPPSD